MKARVLCGVIASLSLVSGSVSVATGADRVMSYPDPAPGALASPTVVELDADRRARLNDRIQAMVRTRKSAPTEPERHGVRPQAPRQATPTRDPMPERVQASTMPSVFRDGHAKDAVAANSAFPPSTIAPPVATSSSARTGRRTRYVAPNLDLQTRPRIPTSDLECLTQTVYYEARNESAEGQAAVAEVVMNRANTGRYPKRVCDVVYQRNSRTCQFTFTCDGSIGRGPVNTRAWARAEHIARNVLERRTPAILPPNSVNYHANYVRPSWGRRLARVRQIGAHIFYGSPLDGGETPGQNSADPRPSSRSGLLFVQMGEAASADPVSGQPQADAITGS